MYDEPLKDNIIITKDFVIFNRYAILNPISISFWS